jgi:hypothetical protein
MTLRMDYLVMESAMGQAAVKPKPSRTQSGHAMLAAMFEEAGPTPPRWICRHHMSGSEIAAYVSASEGIEVIADARQGAGINPRANAELIVNAVNAYRSYQPLIEELVNALEIYAAGVALSDAATQSTQTLCRKARRVMGI